MTFATPLAFAALLLVPVAVALYVRRERRARATRQALVDGALMAAVLPRRAGWRRHVAPAAGITAGAILVVALAKPQSTIAVPVEQAQVIIATDRSGSMLAKDVSPDRLTAARRAAGTFLDAVPRDVRVGAVAFNHVPTVLTGPTRDHETVRTALDGVRAAGSTATGDALDAALKLVGDPNDHPPAAIVLLSDGESVRGGSVSAAAERARAA